ncbi:hypothetical protein [Crocosphaera sp. Alani8]|uniref:hypothetical protein n=1 Tax=Crocosphaera sp. Alani8 TaxID=3038952 RepID=UPI00313DB50F
MRLWIGTVFVLFVLVQFYQWLKGFILPLPIYVLAGSFLAIASNYDKGMAMIIPSSHKQPLTDSDNQTEEN